MKWTKYYKLVLIIGSQRKKRGLFEFSLGVCSTKPSDVAYFWGAQRLVEDERLQKRAISGGSATGGIKANNESMSLKTLFKT